MLARLIAWLLAALLGLVVASVAAVVLGFAGAVLGLVVTVVSAYLAVKQRRLRARLLFCGALGLLLMFLSIGAGASKEKEASRSTDLAKIEADIAARQAARRAKALADLSTSTGDQLMEACRWALRSGGIPVENIARCSALFLAQVEEAARLADRGEWEQAEKLLEEAEGQLALATSEPEKVAAISKAAAAVRRRVQPRVDAIRAEKAEQARTEAARGPMPRISEWDGSVPVVERYLKSKLHDPSSYEHVGSTKPVAFKDAWLVKTQFRAKNAFGAKVLTTKTLLIQQGQVVAELD